MRLILPLLLTLPAALAAQDRQETLADIRQELSVLYVEVQRLKRELSTTGAPSANLSGTSTLERVDAMESELRRLTAKTEEMQFRIDRVVTDGTNRIGDLEFRLCELEAGCDISGLGDTPSLGGEAVAAPEPASPAPPAAGGGPEMAIGEQQDFDRAKEAFDAGSYRMAADQFRTFTQTYPGGALTGEAHFWRGEALAALGEDAEAARAYLEAFSGSPQDARAPEALLKLGLKLEDLGQSSDACVTLGEVTVRYPESEASVQAQTARADFGCT